MNKLILPLVLALFASSYLLIEFKSSMQITPYAAMAPLSVERTAPPANNPQPVQQQAQQSIQQRLDEKVFYSCEDEIKYYKTLVEKNPESEYNKFKLEQVLKRCQSAQERYMKK
jgi:hypothetical protein